MYKRTVNTYSEGMNQDISVNKRSAQSYHAMENFRVTTRDGGSMFAIENEKGTRVALEIPNVQDGFILELSTTDVATSSDPYHYFDVVIGGTPYPVNIPVSQNLAQFSPQITWDAIMSNSDIVDAIDNGELYIKRTRDRIIFIGLDSSLFIVEGNDGFRPNDILTQHIQAQTDLKIIGVGGNREHLVVFTTNNTDTDPDSFGQVWACDWNESDDAIEGLNGDSLVPSKHLVYNNKLDFSTFHKILDVDAKYVSGDVIKIYWTDHHNYLRHLNIADPNSIALPPHLLDVAGDVGFVLPKLKDIRPGGSYKSGRVQYAFQYYNASGVVSRFSPTSAAYHLTESSENEPNTFSYIGTKNDEDTGKSLDIEIPSTNPDYEFLRMVAIFYEDKYQDPQVGIVGEMNVPGDGSGVVVTDNGIYSGNLDIQEYVTMATMPFIPKTIAVKDNRLVAGNIKEPRFDIDFDARAYRANEDGEIKVENASGTETILSSVNDDLPQTHDAINPDQYEYKFKPGTIDIGGAGPNVSYTIQSRKIELDNTNKIRSLGTNTKVDTSYNKGNHTVYRKGFDNFASPFDEELVGYQRDEVYPFAIVFYNKKGQPSFPKWIADVKFPSLTEEEFDSNLFFKEGGAPHPQGTIKANSLYIEFEVNLPMGIASEVENWEIVRMERTEDNKSVVSQGMIEILPDESLWEDGICTHSTPQEEFSMPNQGYFGDIGELNTVPSSDYLYRFVSPDIETNLDFLPNGDFFQVVGRVASVDCTYHKKDEVSNWVETALKIRELTRVTDIDLWKPISHQAVGRISVDVQNVGPYNIRNYISCISNSIRYVFKGKCLLCALDSQLSVPSAWGDADSTQTDFHELYGRGFLYVNYKRTLSKQYGGSNYEDRAQRIYISTGSYNKGSGSVKVFGGDTYVCVYDYLNDIPDPNVSNKEETFQGALYFPVESTSNLHLRHDLSFSRKVMGSPQSSKQITDDTFARYNQGYLREPNVRPFNAQPLFFSIIDHLDTKLMISDKKVGVDLEDSWLKFSVNNEGEVDSRYGPINKIINFKDRLMFYQDTGFGVLAVNERATLSTEVGSELILGSGNIFGDYGYISVMTGSQHHGAVLQSNNFLYHYDALQGKFMQYNIGVTEKPLSDLKGMSSFFRTFDAPERAVIKKIDKPLGAILGFPVGVTSVYDPKYNRVLFTLLSVEESPTIGLRPYSRTFSFSELIGSFESFYSYKPQLYYQHRGRVLSYSGGNTLHEHDKGSYGFFYDTFYDSSITYLMSPDPYMTKAFTNHEFNSHVFDDSGDDVFDDTFGEYRAWNSYQDTGVVALTQRRPLSRIFRNWRIGIPFEEDSRNRMSDRHMFVRLSYNNEDNKRLIMHDLITQYGLREY